MTTESPEARIAAIEARRAERAAALTGAFTVQRAADLEALDALEVERGQGAVALQDMPAWVPGLPTGAVVRVPHSGEMRAFRARAGGKEPGAADKATEALGAQCLVYPSKEDFARMCEVSPAFQLLCGNAACALAVTAAHAEGKG